MAEISFVGLPLAGQSVLRKGGSWGSRTGGATQLPRCQGNERALARTRLG